MKIWMLIFCLVAAVESVVAAIDASSCIVGLPDLSRNPTQTQTAESEACPIGLGVSASLFAQGVGVFDSWRIFESEGSIQRFSTMPTGMTLVIR